MPLFSRKKPLPDLALKTPEELCLLAAAMDDPKARHRVLLEAEKLAPNNLEVQRALLMLGRLFERDPGTVGFSAIKCYLLHAFEHPEEHEAQEQRRMTRELFEEERLKRCLEMAKDRDGFLKEYLEDLSRDYMRVFVVGDNSHVPRVFGLSFRGGLQKYLASPARDIISNIFLSPYMDREEAALLAKAFYKAYYEYAQGQVGELHALLGAPVVALLK